MNKSHPNYKTALKLFPYFFVLYEIAAYSSNDMYLPALPEISEYFEISNNLAQLSLTLWFLGSAALVLAMGSISDKLGRRPTFLTGGVVFVMATLYCSFTESYYSFLIARLLQGISICTIFVAGYACIHLVYPRLQAIRILATMASVTILAPAFGPLVGGFLLKVMGWRHIFLLLAILAAFSLVCMYFVMPEPEKEPHEINLKSVFHHCYNLLSNKAYLGYTISSSLLLGSLIAWIVAGPFLIIEAFKYDPIYFGIFQGGIFGCFILGLNIVRKKVETIDLNVIMCYGISIISVSGAVVIILVFINSNSIWALVGPLMPFALGVGITFAPLKRLAIEACGASVPMGTRIAISRTLSGIATVCTSGIISITDDDYEARVLAVIIGASAILVLFLWLLRQKNIEVEY